MKERKISEQKREICLILEQKDINDIISRISPDDLNLNTLFQGPVFSKLVEEHLWLPLKKWLHDEYAIEEQSAMEEQSVITYFADLIDLEATLKTRCIELAVTEFLLTDRQFKKCLKELITEERIKEFLAKLLEEVKEIIRMHQAQNMYIMQQEFGMECEFEEGNGNFS